MAFSFANIGNVAVITSESVATRDRAVKCVYDIIAQASAIECQDACSQDDFIVIIFLGFSRGGGNILSVRTVHFIVLWLPCC